MSVDLQEKTKAELVDTAKELGVKSPTTLNKAELVKEIEKLSSAPSVDPEAAPSEASEETLIPNDPVGEVADRVTILEGRVDDLLDRVNAMTTPLTQTEET